MAFSPWTNEKAMQDSSDCCSDHATMHMRLFASVVSGIRVDLRSCLPPSGTSAIVELDSDWRKKMWHWEGSQEMAFTIKILTVVIDVTVKILDD